MYGILSYQQPINIPYQPFEFEGVLIKYLLSAIATNLACSYVDRLYDSKTKTRLGYVKEKSERFRMQNRTVVPFKDSAISKA